jgi:hypothetical protein
MSGSDEETRKIQHDTAIGIPPGKWSLRLLRKSDGILAGALVFRQIGKQTAPQN